MTEQNCCFCAVFGADAAEPWNRPLAESNNFWMVPSLGAVVDGWILIVPKSHRLALTQLTPSEQIELDSFSKEAVALLTSAYREPVLEFEHGPCHADSSVGCSVDHAHLHLVPTSVPILENVKHLFPELEWNEFPVDQTLPVSRPDEAYIYFKQDDSGYFTQGEDLPSQLIRRCIAAGMGLDESWNWRNYPCYERVQRTIEVLAPSVGILGADRVVV